MNDFEKYLDINNIGLQDFYKVMNDYLMYEIIARIIDYLDKDKNGEKLKSQLIKCNDDISRAVIIENYIKKITCLKFTDNQRKYILKAIYAYLIKSTSRKNDNTKLKSIIFLKQDGKCSICNKRFSIDYMELDHKLGFKFVGDELDENIQLLCGECNRKKSVNYNYVIKKYLLKS